MKKQRPKNLQLNTIAMPPAAVASILHRISGVAMFFALIFVIWAWAMSLSSADGFIMIQNLMTSFIAKFIAFGTISALAYHIIGGVRHLVMDMGHWEELASGNLSAKFAIGLWVVVTILVGVWLWC